LYDTICHDKDNYNKKTINKIVNSFTNIEPDRMCGVSCIQTFLALVKSNRYFDYIYTTSDRLIKNSVDSSVGYTGISYINDFGKSNFKFLLNLPNELISSNFLMDQFGKRLGPQKKQSIITQFKSYYKIEYELYIRNIQGIFVTIIDNNELQGCIGTFELIGDIIDTILDRTLESAFNDTRFEPIVNKKYTYAINFISKSFKIGNQITDIVKNLKVGKHGIIIYFSDGANATYLPSVLNIIGITQDNLKYTVNKLVKSLADKAGTVNITQISMIELYDGIEYDTT